jgi:uncharacterized protein YbjT (DUF2867 family)
MADVEDDKLPLILLTGGSGYVGGRLIPLLEKQPVKLRCLARTPEKMRPRVQPATEIVQGDVLARHPLLSLLLRHSLSWGTWPAFQAHF